MLAYHANPRSSPPPLVVQSTALHVVKLPLGKARGTVQSPQPHLSAVPTQVLDMDESPPSLYVVQSRT